MNMSKNMDKHKETFNAIKPKDIYEGKSKPLGAFKVDFQEFCHIFVNFAFFRYFNTTKDNKISPRENNYAQSAGRDDFSVSGSISGST